MREQHPLLTAILMAYEYASYDDDSHIDIPIGFFGDNKKIHFANDRFYLTSVPELQEEHQKENQKKLEIDEVDELLYLNDMYQEHSSTCKICIYRWSEMCEDCQGEPI